MCENKVRTNVDAAIKKLLENDSYLLQNNVNERAISHKLGAYLQELFPEWNVDCEYNRNHDDPKRLKLPIKHIKTNDTNAQTVFPDIIIHHRATDENLLAIEIKKSTNSETNENDLRKLRAYKSQLGYKYALFIKFLAGGEKIDIDEKCWV